MLDLGCEALLWPIKSPGVAGILELQKRFSNGIICPRPGDNPMARSRSLPRILARMRRHFLFYKHERGMIAMLPDYFLRRCVLYH